MQPSLKINEIFYSLQGEGANTGLPFVFVRLAKCNLTCSYCDTEFVSYKEIALDEILSELLKYNCKRILWTGGEPLLQLDQSILEWFLERGYQNFLETNGSIKPPDNGFNYITVSPKVAVHVVERNFKDFIIHELRQPISIGRYLPEYSEHKTILKKYASPVFQGDEPDIETIRYVTELVKENPEWSMSIQTHKLLNLK